jgi:hypothetical protein
MELNKDIPNIIYLPEACRTILLEHCRRKLNEIYLPDEPREKKAFGVIAGNKTPRYSMCWYVPLRKNVDAETAQTILTRLWGSMLSLETPLRRGWADAGE